MCLVIEPPFRVGIKKASEGCIDNGGSVYGKFLQKGLDNWQVNPGSAQCNSAYVLRGWKLLSYRIRIFARTWVYQMNAKSTSAQAHSSPSGFNKPPIPAIGDMRGMECVNLFHNLFQSSQS